VAGAERDRFDALALLDRVLAVADESIAGIPMIRFGRDLACLKERHK
jgi:hypothetical protein